MSTQIDTIRESREPGQGSRVRIKEIGKASTATLDDRCRFSPRSVNLTWHLGANHQRTAKAMFLSLRPLTNELETKTKVKSLFAASFLLSACDGLSNLPREEAEFFHFSARIFLEIPPIDTLVLITVCKNVIGIPKERRHFVILDYLLSHRRRYRSSYCCSRIAADAELRSEIGLGTVFQRISGETRHRHQL
jgi:hypothetical protein